MVLISSIFSSLYSLDVSILKEMDLEKIFSHSVGNCFHEVPFVTCWVSYEQYWWFVHEVLFCANSSKAIPYFLLYQVLCILFYIDAFDPFELKFCAGLWIWIYSHSPICWHLVSASPFVEDAVIFSSAIYPLSFDKVTPLSEIRYSCVCGITHGPSIQFHWSICLFYVSTIQYLLR